MQSDGSVNQTGRRNSVSAIPPLGARLLELAGNTVVMMGKVDPVSLNPRFRVWALLLTHLTETFDKEDKSIRLLFGTWKVMSEDESQPEPPWL